jgi:hypothetical protein
MVTLQRFMVGSRTYAMSGVTAVSMYKIPARRGFWLLLVAVAAVVAIYQMPQASPDMAIVLLSSIAGFVALVIAVTRRASYVISLMTASGESRALVSMDRRFVTSIVDAINHVIVARG